MKAVFVSDRAYLQIARDEVMNSFPVYSEEEKIYYRDKNGIMQVKLEGHEQVGSAFKQFHPQKHESFLFQEGEKHNRLTLTDPEEIAGMRAAIEARDYIREISCEE